MKQFNIRVYGVLLNENQEVLLSDERYEKLSFTKFPGGGLCMGESLPEGLMREFMEECDWPIRVEKLLHVTDVFIPSAFDASQVIGIYYLVKSLEKDTSKLRMKNRDHENGSTQSFRWVSLSTLRANDFYFEMDQLAWTAILEQISN